MWERITSINDSWLGWNSTLRFHVWPWPFKFAVVQNTPAFLIGLLLSRPIDSFKPGLPEWVSLLPSLLLVPLLWYLIGVWLDRKRVLGRTSRETVVLIFGVFTAVSLIVAVSSGWILGSYTHVHSLRHRVLDCPGNRHVSFRTPLGAGCGLVRTFRFRRLPGILRDTAGKLLVKNQFLYDMFKHKVWSGTLFGDYFV